MSIRSAVALCFALITTGAGAQNLVTGAGFDSAGDVTLWSPTFSSLLTFIPVDDANGSGASGSMEVRTSSGTNSTPSAQRCIALTSSEQYSFGFKVKLQFGASASMACTAYPFFGCEGTALGSATTTIGTATTSWSELRTNPASPFTLPAGTQSLSCVIAFVQPLQMANVAGGFSPAGLVDDVFLRQGTSPVMLQQFNVD